VLVEFDRSLGVLDRGHQQEVTVADGPSYGPELVFDLDQSERLRLEELIPRQVGERTEQIARRGVRCDCFADWDPELPEVVEDHLSLTELIQQINGGNRRGLLRIY
jgi:hypothetical protein